MICDDKYKYIEYGETIRRKFKGGVSITIRLLDDDHYELDWLGEYQESPEPGSIHDQYPDDADRPYFVPMNSLRERRAWYTKNGYSKHESYTLARAEILDDKRLLDQHIGDHQYRYMAGLVVTIYVNGRKVGLDSLWGIDLSIYASNNQDYLNDIALDCIIQALSEARKSDPALERVYRVYDRLSDQRRKIEKRRAYVQKITAWRKDRPAKVGYGFLIIQGKALAIAIEKIVNEHYT